MATYLAPLGWGLGSRTDIGFKALFWDNNSASDIFALKRPAAARDGLDALEEIVELGEGEAWNALDECDRIMKIYTGDRAFMTAGTIILGRIAGLSLQECQILVGGETHESPRIRGVRRRDRHVDEGAETIALIDVKMIVERALRHILTEMVTSFQKIRYIGRVIHDIRLAMEQQTSDTADSLVRLLHAMEELDVAWSIMRSRCKYMCGLEQRIIILPEYGIWDEVKYCENGVAKRLVGTDDGYKVMREDEMSKIVLPSNPFTSGYDSDDEENKSRLKEMRDTFTTSWLRSHGSNAE